MITKVSNFVLSSLIARSARAMLYKYSDLLVYFRKVRSRRIKLEMLARQMGCEGSSFVIGKKQMQMELQKSSFAKGKYMQVSKSFANQIV